MLLRRVRAGNRQLAQANAQLAQLSESDALTGLANRRGFQAAMQAAPRIEGSMMLVDIDHFKRINDRWGHAAGDVVLVEVARRLRAALRDEDLIVRWGGEEFLLWLPVVSRDEAEVMAERILAALAGWAAGAACPGLDFCHGLDRICHLPARRDEGRTALGAGARTDRHQIGRASCRERVYSSV